MPKCSSPRLQAIAVVAAFLSLASASASADSAFYRIPLKALTLTQGKLPEAQAERNPVNWSRQNFMRPWVRVDGGEAYVQYAGDHWNAWDWQTHPGDDAALVVRCEAGREVAGTLVVPSNDWKRMVPLKFTIPPRDARDDARTAFYRARYSHYEHLLNTDSPGAAWFRFQARAARQALGEQVANEVRPFNNPAFRRAQGLDDTYNLFSGGRALSENLQLDRVLPPARQAQEPTVPVDSLRAIDVKEMDWAPLIKDKHPRTDPLAAYVPIDQHAVFFPSFDAMVALVDEIDTQGVPVLQALEPRAEDARTKERYQRQLCLSMTGLGRLLGPRVIGEIAATGSDPYLRTGSDVAVLFEAKDPAVLKNLLTAQINLGRQRVPAAVPVQGKAAGLDYFGARSPDRSVCSYVAQVGDTNVIVVTNSLKQLDRIAATKDGSIRPLSSAPEYTFFRDCYKRGEEHESALLVLTDATIRRWCGPRWRIADSRRTQAAAVMADLQAKYVNELAMGKVEPTALHAEHYVPEMGELRLTATGVTSSTYGSPDYLTPIIELPADKATAAEADLYNRWRDGYQRNWSNFFDPIAVRLSVHDGKTAADLTVMPLIVGTQYKELVELTRGVRLTPDAADPHDALIHFALAMNRDSPPVKEASGFAKQVAPNLRIDPLGWLGKSVAIYVDDDPLWQDAAKAADNGQDPERFLSDNWHRLPVAVYAESDSPLKLAAFMTAVHAFVDQSAPNITQWDTREYRGQTYVVISSKGSGMQAIDRARLYYVTTPDALILTLNEDVLKHALDRQIARREAKEKGNNGNGQAAAKTDAKPDARPDAQPEAKPDAKKPEPWLGGSAAVQADARAVAAVRGLFGLQYQRQMQELAWGNLPILNEWKRLYPDQDPVKLHERLWQVRLVDPAGGGYVWNDQYQTMESTTYGHPGAPKAGPALPPQVDGIVRAAMGVTFEDQGLRARAVLERKAQ